MEITSELEYLERSALMKKNKDLKLPVAAAKWKVIVYRVAAVEV